MAEPVAEQAEEVLLAEPPTPKKRGRPAGSKDTKPRAPRKPRPPPVPELPEVSEPPEPPELPRVLPGSQPIPDGNALMLQLLRQQAHQRQTQKVNMWKSWFH